MTLALADRCAETVDRDKWVVRREIDMAAINAIPLSKAAAWVGFLERVGSTFLQAFFAALLATSGGAVQSRVDWQNAALIGLFAAIVSVATSLLTLIQKLKKYFDNAYSDLVYRVVITFAQTYVGLLVAAQAQSAITFDWNTALKTSLIAAGTALIKALIGINSDTVGASTLVKAPPPAAPPSAAAVNSPADAAGPGGFSPTTATTSSGTD